MSMSNEQKIEAAARDLLYALKDHGLLAEVGDGQFGYVRDAIIPTILTRYFAESGPNEGSPYLLHRGALWRENER